MNVLQVASGVRVFEVVKPPDGTTRYVDQVVADADPDVTFSFVSLTRFVRLDYDVVHLHWPEMVVRHRVELVERLKCLLFDSWVRVLRWRRIAVIQTLHNVKPHDSTSPAVRRTLDRLATATDLFVTINSTTVVEQKSVYIPHGHYRHRFDSIAKPPTRVGRLLYAGLIRPYKGVEQLLKAFLSVRDPALSLRIVGKPTDALREVVVAAVDAAPEKVSARLEFVPDIDFVEEISRAEMVCLPYHELHNSGILLVALSLDRPVLVPETPSTRALAEEVGPGWVMTFTGELDSADIERALSVARSAERSHRPAFVDRDWKQVGSRYSAAFRIARAHAFSK